MSVPVKVVVPAEDGRIPVRREIQKEIHLVQSGLRILLKDSTLLITGSIVWKNELEADLNLEEGILIKEVVIEIPDPDQDLGLGIVNPVEEDPLVMVDHLEDPDIIRDRDQDRDRGQIQKTGTATGQGDPSGSKNSKTPRCASENRLHISHIFSDRYWILRIVDIRKSFE